jgi:hypothetical protein
MKRAAFAALSVVAVVGLAAAPATASVRETTRACAQPNDRVTSIAIRGITAYIAGDFTSVKRPNGTQQARSRLAAIDTVTCDLLPWTASANAEVLAIQVVGSTVYAGGAFTTVNGVSRARLAALSADTGALLPFSPVANRTVRTLTASGSMLYAGGDFTAIGTAGRKKLAAFALDSGALSATWKPVANGRVETLALSSSGTSVYVGGAFTALSGESAAGYLAAVDATTGALDRGFRPRPGFPMLKVTADSRGVYSGGGGSGGHMAIWNLDGSPQRPVYQTDGGVQALAVDGDALYLGGHFGNYCIGGTGSGSPYICTNPLPRRKLFEVSLGTGALTSWAPSLNSPRGVFAMAVDPRTGDLWTGGDFTKVGTQSVTKLAVFSR